ncbi:MAG: GNAT family N-acetyltransferase [Salibacteraceae bacterium]
MIETKRLILRELNASDAKSLFELNADLEVLKYTGDTPFASIEAANSFLKNYSDYQQNGFGRWAVIKKSTDEFLGWSGLKRNEQGLIDLGFRFHQRHWGNGYGTESARACLEYGFNTLELHQIIGRASKDNIASVRILEKIGMSFWKTDVCKGIPNAAYYRINKPEFNNF